MARGPLKNKEISRPTADAAHQVPRLLPERELTSTARVRIIPVLPWKFDFNDKQVPPTWIGSAYRHKPIDVEGESMLVKVKTIPKGTRSQSWMGWTRLARLHSAS